MLAKYFEWFLICMHWRLADLINLELSGNLKKKKSGNFMKMAKIKEFLSDGMYIGGISTQF